MLGLLSKRVVDFKIDLGYTTISGIRSLACTRLCFLVKRFQTVCSGPASQRANQLASRRITQPASQPTRQLPTNQFARHSELYNHRLQSNWRGSQRHMFVVKPVRFLKSGSVFTVIRTGPDRFLFETGSVPEIRFGFRCNPDWAGPVPV